MSESRSVEKKSSNSGRFRWILAGLILAGLILAGVFLVRNGEEPADVNIATDRQSQLVPVVVTNPVRRTFEQLIVTQGNVEAKNVAMVSPRIPGTLEEIFVDEGDYVVAGRTELFQTDAVKLQQNVAIKEHELAVARCALKQAQAGLEKVTADFDKAEMDYKRFERLLEKEATTQDLFEQQQSNYKQLAASKKVSLAQVELAAEKARQAEAALVIAEKDLADTTVMAPINGVVSMRMAEPGEMGSPGVPVLRIEEPNLVEVSAFLPAAIYPAVIAGQTLMRVTVAGIELPDQVMSYKSPTIGPKLRTFEIKCLLENPPDSVAPGAMADIVVILASREGLGVPAVSVQQRGGQSVVFVIEGDIARKRNVRTGLENDGWIELLDGDLTESMQVVSMGQDMLDDGIAVSVQKEAE
jgi:RND family efflux transporter MFP subunit